MLNNIVAESFGNRKNEKKKKQNKGKQKIL